LYVDGFLTTFQPNGPLVDRFAMVLTGDSCFLDFMHRVGPGDSPWRDDARFQLWLTPNGITLFHPFRLALRRDPPPIVAASLQKYWLSPFAEAIGWHPQVEFFEALQSSSNYLDAFMAKDRRVQLAVFPQADTVGAYKCVVVEAKTPQDRLWLCPDLDYALVKRVTVIDLATSTQRTVHCRAFKKAAEGLWLPREVDVEMRESANQGRVLSSFRIDVQNISVNEDVPLAVFQFRPPEGTLTYDSAENVIGFEQGGESALDLWAIFCGEVLARNPPWRQSWLPIVTFVPANVVALVAVGVCCRCVYGR
jgi:hypothetical protein